MPWIIGGGVLYVVLLVTLGVLCARNGHWIMFVLGFFFPFLWLIGAVLRRSSNLDYLAVPSDAVVNDMPNMM